MMKPLFLFLLALLFILPSCKTTTIDEIRDGFESDSLNKIWSNEKFIPGALEFQTTYVRSGQKAISLTLHQGDQIDEEKGTILERAELKESKKLMCLEDQYYSYSFSMFLPADFPVVANRLVIAQWKQNCKSGKCDPDNPVIALRYESGEFRITLQTGPEKNILYKQQEGLLNVWQDFRFQIRFSRNQNGRIKGFLNDKKIIDFEGVTAYSQTYGYPESGNFYFKFGLYRDSMEQPMTIYFDDYEKKQLQ